VHALGQVIAFTWTGRIPEAELGRAIAASLPRDVAIRDLRRAPRRFHPRHAARYREYRYTIWNGPRSPLRERFALGVRAPLDTAAMAQAASVLVGRHDFSAFGAKDRQPVRTLHWVRVRRAGQLVTVDVAGDAFLRGMVRRIVAILLEVGHGSLDDAAVGEALASPGPALNGAAAPARGLCLQRVVLGRPMKKESTRAAGSAAHAAEPGEAKQEP
jgi:tRNA pseudouridine38-40 synthase